MDDVWGEDFYRKGKNGICFQPGWTVSAESSFLFSEAFVFTPPIFSLAHLPSGRVGVGGGSSGTLWAVRRRRVSKSAVQEWINPQGRKSG